MVENLAHFGTLADGRDVQVITLTAGDLSARVIDYGARLMAYQRGEGPNVHVTSDSVADFEGAMCYAGPIIGPVINRITGAQADIDGTLCHFDANQGDRHTLHSGRTGTHTALWTIDTLTDAAVTLSIALADGAGGFPGNRTLTARYGLEDGGLTLTITATTDAVTLMNPGHHGIWNADGMPTWKGQLLEVPAARYLPVDADTLPTGEIADVAGTQYDHRAPAVPDPSLDHNFCFEGGFGPRCRLIGQTQTLEIHSDAPGLQAYAGGAAGLALEPQLWPDAPKNSAFPSILLGPGETFQQRSRFVISA
ncbi:MAG: galactose mutarotase [Pseudomonadota bacterium]